MSSVRLGGELEFQAARFESAYSMIRPQIVGWREVLQAVRPVPPEGNPPEATGVSAKRRLRQQSSVPCLLRRSCANGDSRGVSHRHTRRGFPP
ncbi:hypothetical protein SAMD00079811_63210 [Scytonema sp. HK-05]|nr:hypothetical protein SAMD00079811_63210 [Scytonema sp. HK-05]